MTRAELVSGEWRIVKRHAETGQVVAISEKTYGSRRLANYAYSRGRLGYLENKMQFVKPV